MKIECCNAELNTAIPVVWIEAKHPGGSYREAEEQGLDVAKRCLDTTLLHDIYVITVWGLGFRAWYVDYQQQALHPLVGLEQGHKTDYLDILSQRGATEPSRTVSLIQASCDL